MSVYRLLMQVIARDQASGELRKVKDSVAGLQTQSGLLTTALKGLGVAGMLYAGKQAASMAWELGELGAQSMRLGTAFDELASQAGGSADEMLAAIKRATGGTVSEMEIMAAANKGILLGLGANAEQWAQLTEVARYRARAMGLSVTQALNDISVGIGRESRLILDNLGIILDLDQVTQDYAATLGKTADALTATERKQAILNSVISEGQTQIAAAGGITGDYADSFERMQASIGDLKVALGETFAPAIANLADAITEVIKLAGGGMSSAMEEAAFRASAAGGSFEDVAEAARRARIQIESVGKSFTPEGWAIYQSGIQLTAEQLVRLGIATKASSSEILAVAERMGIAKEAAWLLASSLPKVSDALTIEQEAALKLKGALDGAAAATYNLATANWFLATSARTASDIYEYRREQLVNERATVQDLIDINAQVPGILAAQARAAEDAASRWVTAYDAAAQSLRSAVEAALTPTSVTALDFALPYEDQWDEDARRLDAIAARGFEELDAHPDWAAMLEIPPEVLAAGEEALRAWAAQQSQLFRNLFVPLDEGDVDAAVDRVRQYLQQQATREENITKVVAKLTAEGFSKEQIQEALGEVSPVKSFAGVLEDDIKSETGALSTAGERLWSVTEQGILAGMDKGLYIEHWLLILVPAVAQALQQQGYWTGGGQQP